MSFQGRWLGLVAGAWLGAVQPAPQTGYQSLLAFWSGGAATGAAPQAGYRSLLGHWAGGASAEPASQVGCRSLLAYWAGGAGAEDSDTPEPPEASGGGLVRQAAKSERDRASERAALLRRIGLDEVEPTDQDVKPPRRVTSLRDLAALLPPREATQDQPAQVEQGAQQSLTRVAAEIAANVANQASIAAASELAYEAAAEAAILRRENNNRAAILIALLMANA